MFRSIDAGGLFEFTRPNPEIEQKKKNQSDYFKI